MAADGPILAVGPAHGGVAHVFAHVVDELRHRGRAVDAVTLGTAAVPALEGIGAAVRRRRGLRAASAVHVELGSNDLAVFWFLLAASLVRPDLVAVAHDVSLKLVKSPGAALVGSRSPWALRLGHRVLSPALDRLLVAVVRRRVRRWGVLGAEAAATWAPQVRGRVDVLPHGADAATPGAPAPSAARSVLYAGFMSPDKGIDLLVGSWAAVGAETDATLVLAGTAAGPIHVPFVAALRAEGDRQPNPPTWLEHPSDAAFAQLFAQAAIVVLPYRASSAASGILVRAMVEGRCIVATDVPAVRAHVRPGIDGVVVAPGDRTALTAALSALLHDGARRDALGAAAGARAAQRFSWRAQVDALEALYGR